MKEQDIRIEARNWCGPVDTEHGATENQVENIAIHFFNKGLELSKKQFKKEFLNKIKKDVRVVNENDLQSGTIEFSYSGELIPIEVVEEIVGEILK